MQAPIVSRYIRSPATVKYGWLPATLPSRQQSFWILKSKLLAWPLTRAGIAIITLVAIVFWALPAEAIQGHGGPEGLYGHQLAHIFFVISMGLLIYWLRRWELVRQTGWSHIQSAALFFILWNLDAFAAHMMVEQIKAVDIIRESTWQVRIVTDPPSAMLAWTYYVIKFDHLLCVPAMICLFRGLQLLARGALSAPGGKREGAP